MVMTYSEAIEKGFVRATFNDVTWTRGYVSRTVKLNNSLVVPAKGARTGQWYCLAPSMCSTRYCHRVYLIPPPGWGEQRTL